MAAAAMTTAVEAEVVRVGSPVKESRNLPLKR
jgi:hypothetical protein